MVEAVRSRGLYMMHGCSHVASLVQWATPSDIRTHHSCPGLIESEQASAFLSFICKTMQPQEELVVDAEMECVTSKTMQPQEELVVDAEMECVTSNPAFSADDWVNFRDDDIMKQQTAICAEEAGKIPFVGDKEPLSSLAAEYQSGSPVLQEKIKVLGEQYAAIRRTRGDGNCFFRSFMFSYLEHILESQDKVEVVRITANVEQCKKTLQSLGYADFTFEDFFVLFIEQLENVLQGNETSISHDELVRRSRDQSISDYVVMFFRFVTSGEIRRRSEFFEPFILGLTNATVDQFCKTSVEPMGEESDHVHITALTDALVVPIRVVYLDRSSCDSGGVSVNHHDFIPAMGDLQTIDDGGSGVMKPIITLLYRPGHYDILYSK